MWRQPREAFSEIIVLLRVAYITLLETNFRGQVSELLFSKMSTKWGQMLGKYLHEKSHTTWTTQSSQGRTWHSLANMYGFLWISNVFIIRGCKELWHGEAIAHTASTCLGSKQMQMWLHKKRLNGKALFDSDFNVLHDLSAILVKGMQ